MPVQDPTDAIAQLKKYIERVVHETAACGNDVATLTADIQVILAKAGSQDD